MVTAAIDKRGTKVAQQPTQVVVDTLRKFLLVPSTSADEGLDDLNRSIVQLIPRSCKYAMIGE